MTLGVAAVGGGGLWKLGELVFTRKITTATAAKLQADAKQQAAKTAQTEVDTIRSVLGEVREESAKKDARLDALEGRIDKLEERERHMLTRASVHEAWDQLAFAALIAMNPKHPPPPPLVGPEDRGDT